jgi:hypothetical protein
METTAEFKQELALQRLWARRLNGSANIFEEDLSELLFHSEAFPPAQVEVIYTSFFILIFIPFNDFIYTL